MSFELQVSTTKLLIRQKSSKRNELPSRKQRDIEMGVLSFLSQQVAGN